MQPAPAIVFECRALAWGAFTGFSQASLARPIRPEARGFTKFRDMFCYYQKYAFYRVSYSNNFLLSL